MVSRVKKINSDQTFNYELDKFSTTQLTVIDFFATWCGPCHAIAPKFEEFSQQFVIVNFLKVDVDRCPNTAARYGIQAMPTFVFLKNGGKVDEIRGANPHKLEEAIFKWAGTPDDLVPDPKRVTIGKSFPCYTDLLTNDKEIFEPAALLIIKIANNILKNPTNLRYRQMQLANKKFMEKLLPAEGAVNCLFTMGFEEMDDRLVLPQQCSLDDLFILRDTLKHHLENSRKQDVRLKSEEPKKQIESSSNIPQNSNSIDLKVIRSNRRLNTKFNGYSNEQQVFFSRIKSTTELMLLYEEDELQKLALSKIPVDRLKKEAEKNSASSKDENNKISVSVDDCLLLELLSWFKNEFFSWTNNPPCNRCSNQQTNSIGGSEALPSEKLWDAGVVECYECSLCNEVTRFPRYNHPQKLLETKTGRCGEWANCFTLCCRSLGFETRYALDWTDHVWTEVYSHHQKRWLHCDPCENICDKPLVYETGWKKELSYILAFSKNQVVDVSWRYSREHQKMIKRRNKVNEKWLFELCCQVTNELQHDLSDKEKDELSLRTMIESVEFLSPKKDPSAEEKEGRISGSLAWRQLRGETTVKDKNVKPKSGYVFRPTDSQLKQKRMRIVYKSSKNCYYNISSEDQLQEEATLNNWENGVNSCENIFRKIELDWKMVYLARKEGTDHASIAWKFELGETSLLIDRITVKVATKCYENGSIVWTLCNDDKCVQLENNETESKDFTNSSTVTLSAHMKGGKVDIAWQHTQLFRCSLGDKDFIGLDIVLTLKEK